MSNRHDGLCAKLYVDFCSVEILDGAALLQYRHDIGRNRADKVGHRYGESCDRSAFDTTEYRWFDRVT